MPAGNSVDRIFFSTIKTIGKPRDPGDEQQAKSNEQRVNSNEQRANSNEQRANSNQQQANSNEQQAKSNEQQVSSNEQRANSNQQRAKSNEQQAKSNEQRAISSVLEKSQCVMTVIRQIENISSNTEILFRVRARRAQPTFIFENCSTE